MKKSSKIVLTVLATAGVGAGFSYINMYPTDCMPGSTDVRCTSSGHGGGGSYYNASNDKTNSSSKGGSTGENVSRGGFGNSIFSHFGRGS